MITLTPDEELTIRACDKIAVGWDQSSRDPDFWRPEFEKFRQLLPRGRIIDLGCGGGRDALLFTQYDYYEYVGIDLLKGVLSEARKLAPSGQYSKMSMHKLGFKPGSFDGFWATASLLHIPKARVQNVLEEIKRVVKPGGAGFIAMKEGRMEGIVSCLDGSEQFIALYKLVEFFEILVSNGFQVLEQVVKQKGNESRRAWLLYFVKTADIAS